MSGVAMTSPRELADRLWAWSYDDRLGDGMLLRKAAECIRALAAELAEVKKERDEANANASKIAIEAIGAAAKMKAAEAERLAANIRSCALGRATRGIDGMIRDELLRIAERVRTNDWEQ